MIFITGATGSIGSELCRLLAKDKIPARAMCRREEQLQQFTALGLEAVLADFNNKDSLQTAIKGCTKLFLLTSPDEYHTQRESAIIDIAIEAGIRHIVRISTADANLSSKLSYAKTHAQVDHYLRSKPVDWTIIRSTGFMQNFIESSYPIAKGMLPHMMAEGQISYIDLRDIALVAKHILTENGHKNAVYFLTGPQSLTVNEVANYLTKSLEHNVQAKNITEAEMRTTLGYAKMDAWHIDALIEQFIIGANGGEIDVTEEVKRITGQEPRTFAQFMLDYKNIFLKH